MTYSDDYIAAEKRDYNYFWTKYKYLALKFWKKYEMVLSRDFVNFDDFWKSYFFDEIVVRAVNSTDVTKITNPSDYYMYIRMLNYCQTYITRYCNRKTDIPYDLDDPAYGQYESDDNVVTNVDRTLLLERIEKALEGQPEDVVRAAESIAYGNRRGSYKKKIKLLRELLKDVYDSDNESTL